MEVFVTDGEQRSTLAVVRALGRAAIPVTVGSSLEASLAGCSRYCSKTVRYPSPSENSEGFQAFLDEEVASGLYRLLLPMTDLTAQLVAQMREHFSPQVQRSLPNEEQVKRAQDKRQTLLAAQRLGIACPETWFLNGEKGLVELARAIRYPAVIKPRFSRFFHAGTWVNGQVQYAQGPGDLINKYRGAETEIPDPIVQEKIEGEGRGIFLLVWDGKLKAAFCHRRLREKPPWGGASVYCESLPLDRPLVEKSLALLQEIGWQGPAMVEFKLDRADRRAKLMEINGRFWGSLQLAIDAGVNFPLLLYRLVAGEDVPAQFDYTVGVKSRWLLGDLDHLLIRLRHSQWPNGTKDPSISNLRACLNFLKFYERGLHYEVLRLDDPTPGWFELKGYVEDGFRGLAMRQEEVRAG
jgi:predicted ATP-grasp superfamily ATP-dependent carboligase